MLVVRRGEQQTRCANAVGSDDRDVGSLKMLGSGAIDIRGTCDKTAAIGVQTPHSRSCDQAHPERHIARPVRPIGGAFGSLDAAPHAGCALRARLEIVVWP